jgi:hypothetical protein
LNEKLRGAGSSNDRLSYRQARWVENWSSRPSVDQLDQDQALGQADGRLDRVGQAAAGLLVGLGAAGDQPVDHDLDVVLVGLGQPDRLRQVADLAVDPGPGEALGREAAQQGLVLALAAPHHRGQELEAGAGGQLEDLVDDLVGGLAGDGPAAHRAVGLADAGVQQPQVVVDLGDGADGGAGVLGGGLLVDRDGRGQALDEVDVGLLHQAEELAGIGRQRLDIAALALGVDGVEGERGLARPGQAREHDQGVAGQVQVDVLEVVLACAPDDEAVGDAQVPFLGSGGSSAGPHIVWTPVTTMSLDAPTFHRRPPMSRLRPRPRRPGRPAHRYPGGPSR